MTERPPVSGLLEPSATVAGGRTLRWHALDADRVLEAFGVTESGLDAAEVARRRAEYGPNELDRQPPTHPLVVLIRQFRSPLIYILLLATAVTLALGEYIDAAVIAAVLILNAVIGFTQERRAEGAVRALQGLVVARARVVREGHEIEIDGREIVPGDIVVIESGSRIPADLRLTRAVALDVDESMLTGESMTVTKSPVAVDESAVLADRTSMAFTGTSVTAGRGRGVAIGTGSDTELGAIAGMIRAEETTETPLQIRMRRLAHVIGIIVGVASVVVFVSGVALGGDAGEMFLTAVALAVAAIPEGLPVVFTVTLALGVRRMAQRQAIIRRLPAVETLGSTTVIGSDKTGTLTENRMTVRRIWAGGRMHHLRGDDPTSGFVADSGSRGVSGDGTADGQAGGHEPDETLRTVLTIGALTNEATVLPTADGRRVAGDPTEVALLLAALGHDIVADDLRSRLPVFAEIPFESDRRYSAVVVEVDGAHEVYVKGAPERIIDMCSMMAGPDGPVPIDVEAMRQVAHDLAADGLRVLAMAWRRHDRVMADPSDVAEPEGLVLAGMQGMLDPPRVGVREAIATCRRAGVDVVMITGDHADTARAIAADLGIAPADARVITGSELQASTDSELRADLDEVRVFARVAPEDKLRIVRALRDRDEIVAVTGDGVNDAPALKAAAIGVAMGRSGTDVAREASDMVLADDDFVSIAAAVEEGRVTFDNVRKVTFFLVSTAAATIIAIAVGVWLGWPLIMLPAQLLWLNLVTNGLQDIALGFEPGEDGVLDRPPRRIDEGVLSRLGWERAVVAGAVMALGTLVLFRWQLDRSDLEAAQTTALTTMVVFMAFHAGNSRSENRSVFVVSPLSNPFLLLATLATLAVHIGSLYFGPTRFVLRVEPLDLATWVRIVPVAATIILAMEIHKRVRRSVDAVVDEPIGDGMPPRATRAELG